MFILMRSGLGLYLGHLGSETRSLGQIIEKPCLIYSEVFKQGKQLPLMHVLFVTAFASLVIYLNFTKCKANCIFVMHCINKPQANNEI